MIGKLTLTLWLAFAGMCFNPSLSWAATDVLLYVSDSSFDTGSEREIHLMRPDGTDHRILRTDYPVSSASLMPDGQWIVYATPKRKELRQLHVSGKREKVLVRLRHSVGPKGPNVVRVSPNGRYVAYTRYYPRGYVGIEVYDTRQRRYQLRQIFGKANGSRYKNTVRRLLWTPDSKTVAASVDHLRYSSSINRWFHERFTLVFSRPRNKLVRQLRYLEINDREPLDFVSNTELLQFGRFEEPRFNIANGMWRYNFVTNRSTELLATMALTEVKGIAVSPSRRSISMDINHITAFLTPWSSLSGTPRTPSHTWYRTFALLSLNTLAARYSSPLNFYSEMAQFKLENMSTFYTSSFEWRRVASAEAFRGSLCWGFRVTQSGTSANDTIVGTPGADVIASGSGDDVINSGAGDDVICASSGNDTVNAGPGNDLVFGDLDVNQNNPSEIVFTGNDTLIGSAGSDALHGLKGRDRIRGDAGDDWLFGGGDNDRLIGGSGEDDIYGGTGNDFLDGVQGDDTGDGGDGTDTCRRILITSSCER